MFILWSNAILYFQKCDSYILQTQFLGFGLKKGSCKEFRAVRSEIPYFSANLLTHICSIFPVYRQVFSSINAANMHLFADTGKIIDKFFRLNQIVIYQTEDGQTHIRKTRSHIKIWIKQAFLSKSILFTPHLDKNRVPSPIIL